ncbi:homoserine kinase [Alteromonas sp. ASW11-130]|uniref:homoserine kinase n=1 Tax=Alteromonas sp. ASW11-130 TaxID=3015775 RepID=UPI002241A7F9|nr:homoserine kinase [Alteromonas sp. ASW11-130]MCW8091777.1 homoserine kinase [Alteromonas sp. ASW11-130]
MKRITAYAPASIGNVSLGFDVLGAALAPVDGSKIGDEVEIKSTSGPELFNLSVAGEFADKLPSNPRRNIVFQCYRRFIQSVQNNKINETPIHFTLKKNLPIGSGLGSSASSIVAALTALNAYFDNPLSENQLLTMMGEMEGEISGSIHYDNVAPSFLGGITLMTGLKDKVAVKLPVISEWYWVICYAGIVVSTAAARKILPTSFSMQDTITFGRQLAVFVEALHAQDAKLASSVIHDVIAEPHRKRLLPGFDEVKKGCISLGASAFGISGSGPTVFAVCESLPLAQQVEKLLAQRYIQTDKGFTKICTIEEHGTTVSGKL